MKHPSPNGMERAFNFYDMGYVTAGAHPEMALFHNPGVNLRDSLCGLHKCASEQSRDFIDLVKNCRFLNRTLTRALFSFMDGHQLI